MRESSSLLSLSFTFMIQLPKASWLISSGWSVKGLVDLNDRTGDGAHQVAGGLDALHGAEIVLGGDLVIYLGHIDIDDIAQALLCVVGDTYIGLVALNLHILVALAVVEPFNYFCHSFCY